MSTATEITFGVEIECTVPYGAVQVGGYHAGLPVAGMPAGWVAMHDGSIRGRNQQACEFVSPVLCGAEGLQSVIAAVAFIKSIGGRVNTSCGFHVHVGVDPRDTKALDRLVTLGANFEKAIYATTGTKRRERSRWCGSVQSFGSVETAKRSFDRYRVVNLCNVLGGGRPTVEFRAFAGTLNVSKIVGYVRLCVGMVERAQNAKRITSWTAKQPVESSPIHRDGEGQTQLNRLFYQLGWTKGRTQHTYGALDAERAPTMRNSKKTLMGLARKYDASL